MTLRFKYASVPLILRADQKDNAYIRRLSDGLQSMATLLKGARFVSTYETALTSLAEALYYYTTLVVTGQTLGDEYADLLPLTSSGRPLRWVLVHAAARVLVPILLRRLLSRYFPNVSPAAAVHHVNIVHTALFFIEGKYHTLANRLLGSRPIAMTAEGASTGSNLYPFLGVLLLIQESILLYQWRRSSSTETASAAAEVRRAEEDLSAPNSDSERRSADQSTVDRGRCPLCLSDRVSPAATRCGHIFCWDCIMKWFETSNASSPVCPNCRQPCLPQSVVLLANYAAVRPAT